MEGVIPPPQDQSCVGFSPGNPSQSLTYTVSQTDSSGCAPWAVEFTVRIFNPDNLGTMQVSLDYDDGPADLINIPSQTDANHWSIVVKTHTYTSNRIFNPNLSFVKSTLPASCQNPAQTSPVFCKGIIICVRVTPPSPTGGDKGGPKGPTVTGVGTVTPTNDNASKDCGYGRLVNLIWTTISLLVLAFVAAIVGVFLPPPFNIILLFLAGFYTGLTLLNNLPQISDAYAAYMKCIGGPPTSCPVPDLTNYLAAARASIGVANFAFIFAALIIWFPFIGTIIGNVQVLDVGLPACGLAIFILLALLVNLNSFKSCVDSQGGTNQNTSTPSGPTTKGPAGTKSGTTTS